MDTIRCTGRQLQTIIEQVTASDLDAQLVLTQHDGSSKVGAGRLESPRVFDHRGSERDDAWAAA